MLMHPKNLRVGGLRDKSESGGGRSDPLCESEAGGLKFLKIRGRGGGIQC